MQTADAQLLVLCVLARGPSHGYAIGTAVEELTGQRLGRGSLSSALARLEGKQLIEPLPAQGRQRPLRLTGAGRRLLEDELHSAARVTQRMFEAAVPDRAYYQSRLAATEGARAYKGVMLQALAVTPGHAVLDLGCGPGTDMGALAAAVAGAVVGIDRDPVMAERALLQGRRVLLGDAHALPVRSASFDRVWADRLLQHVSDPGQVLAEARRVLRPQGRIVMAEPDWESLAFDHPDPESSRAYTRHLVDKVVRNGIIGRQLSRLARGAGLEVRDVAALTTVLRDVREADQMLGFQRNAQRAVKAGYLTAPAAQEWLDALASEPFLAAVTIYVVTADAPAALLGREPGHGLRQGGGAEDVVVRRPGQDGQPRGDAQGAVPVRVALATA